MKIKIPSKYGRGDCQIISQNKFRRYPHEKTYFARNLSGKFVLLFKKFRHFRERANIFSEYLPKELFDATNLAIGHRVVYEPK